MSDTELLAELDRRDLYWSAEATWEGPEKALCWHLTRTDLFKIMGACRTLRKLNPTLDPVMALMY